MAIAPAPPIVVLVPTFVITIYRLCRWLPTTLQTNVPINRHQENDGHGSPPSKPLDHQDQQNTGDDGIPLDQKYAAGKKPARRVCFSELPPKHVKKAIKAPRGSVGCPNSWRLYCAWAIMVVFAFSLSFFIIGAIFFAFIQSDLPEIHVQKMSFTKLDIKPSSSSSSEKAMLSSDVDLSIVVSNKNQIIGLSYGTMTVHIRSEKISLGVTEIVGFSQHPNNTKVIQVKTAATNSEVDKEEGEALKSNYKNKAVILDVLFYTTMGFNIGALKINGMPIMVECLKIEQSMVDLGKDPKCSIKLLVSRDMGKAVEDGY